MKLYILTLTLWTSPSLFAIPASERHDYGTNAFSDVKFSELRPNGRYNIICLNGSLEFDIPLERLESAAVCSDPYISTETKQFTQGEAVVVYYSNLPRGKYDWVGVFLHGSPHKEYLDYHYTYKRPSGEFRFCHLPPGDYQIRLFFNDSYTMEHEIEVTILEAPNLVKSSCK